MGSDSCVAVAAVVQTARARVEADVPRDPPLNGLRESGVSIYVGVERLVPVLATVDDLPLRGDIGGGATVASV